MRTPLFVFFNVFAPHSIPEAYDHPHRISLVLFGSEVEVACPFTPLFDKFKKSVDSASAGGDTRLWDAVDRARQDLAALVGGTDPGGGRCYPACLKRVLVLSDGKDTKSSLEAFAVARQCRDERVVVDAVSLGHDENDDLKVEINRTFVEASFGSTNCGFE